MFIQNFLKVLRTCYAKMGRKFIVLLSIVSIVGLTSGFIIDVFVPFGAIEADYSIFETTVAMLPQFLRMGVSLVVGSAIFALGYIILVATGAKSVRERYTYKQRRNLSLIAIAPILYILLAFASGSGPAFTFISTIIISVVLALLTFVRQSKNEEIKEIHNIPDHRDLAFAKKVKDKKESENVV